MPQNYVTSNTLDNAVGAAPATPASWALGTSDTSSSAHPDGETHSQKHNDISAVLVALETKVGVTNSTDSASMVYRTAFYTKALFNLDPSSANPTATNNAIFNVRNGIACLNFPHAGTPVNTATVWVRRVPHNAQLGSGVKAIITWAATSDTNTGHACKWQVDFDRLSGHSIDSSSYPTAGTADTGTGAPSSTPGQPVQTTITVGSGNLQSIGVGELFAVRLTRLATDAADTITEDVSVFNVSIESAVS
jgi:hypothetical protein